MVLGSRRELILTRMEGDEDSVGMVGTRGYPVASGTLTVGGPTVFQLLPQRNERRPESQLIIHTKLSGRTIYAMEHPNLAGRY